MWSIAKFTRRTFHAKFYAQALLCSCCFCQHQKSKILFVIPVNVNTINGWNFNKIGWFEQNWEFCDNKSFIMLTIMILLSFERGFYKHGKWNNLVIQNYESKDVHLSIILPRISDTCIRYKGCSKPVRSHMFGDSSYPKYLAQGHKQDDCSGASSSKTDGLVIISPLLLY